ncbi:MAG TPA: MBL fold metallo-hydrolase [Planctomycetota bacterium]|nr:MBL fold metallo-hydrolase [Planctomycetota bacterium]
MRRLLVALVLSLAGTTLRAAAQSPCCDPWTDLGQALAGASGAPTFEATGSLADGTQLVFELDGAAASAPSWLLAGFTSLAAPFKGGVMVPEPQAVVPLVTDASGHLSLVGSWPLGVPQATTLFAQFWVQDAGAPKGYAASNAQLGTTPPPPPTGSLPADWINGSNCGGDPPIQIQQYGDNTWILRQNKCTNFEGPFMFLFFGQDRGIMFDTGAGNIPIYTTVNGIVQAWATAHGKVNYPLTVAHTHSHGDHIAGDSQFAGKPDVTLVGTSQTAVAAFFGFQDWPNDIVQYELGGRTLDILAIPGHQAAHIAIFDHETCLFLTGDTLYPGHLFISGAVSQGNFAKYKASCQRMVDFVADKPIAIIWGNHVEAKNTPFQFYPYPTSSQPNEHDPYLDRAHLIELNDAVQAMTTPHVEAHADFSIEPNG